MKEITGNLWDYYGKPGYVVCITTNGKVNVKGDLVMGRGCALEAKRRNPALPFTLGDAVKTHGNICHLITVRGRDPGSIMSFPTKHNWWEKSDIKLIEQSAKRLEETAQRTTATFILPRPGCGNGGLQWEDVKPVIQAILPDNVWIISH